MSTHWKKLNSFFVFLIWQVQLGIHLFGNLLAHPQMSPLTKKKGRPFLKAFFGGMMLVHNPLAYQGGPLVIAIAILRSWMSRAKPDQCYQLGCVMRSWTLKKHPKVTIPQEKSRSLMCVFCLFFVFLLSSKGIFQRQIEIPFDLRRIWRQFQHVFCDLEGVLCCLRGGGRRFEKPCTCRTWPPQLWGRNSKQQTLRLFIWTLDVTCAFGRICRTLFWNILLKSYKKFED